MRTEISPFTGEYYKLIDYGQTSLFSRCRKHKDEITKAETEDGWKGLYKDGMLSKCKTFLKPTYFGNHVRNVGAIKNTYEVVGDHGVFTYEISRIPQYKNAMRALKETMDLILSDEMDVNVNWNHHGSKTRGKNIKQSVMEEYEKKRKQRILDEQKKKKVGSIKLCNYLVFTGYFECRKNGTMRCRKSAFPMKTPVRRRLL